jgi:sRNA-binding carbon storage regulator CsrA
MLVKTVSRGTPIKLLVGTDFEVSLWWHNGQVKIGIEAPRSVKIETQSDISGRQSDSE